MTAINEFLLRHNLRIAAELIFLAGNTGLVPQERCVGAGKLLESYTTLDAMLGDISR